MAKKNKAPAGASGKSLLTAGDSYIVADDKITARNRSAYQASLAALLADRIDVELSAEDLAKVVRDTLSDDLPAIAGLPVDIMEAFSFAKLSEAYEESKVVGSVETVHLFTFMAALRDAVLKQYASPGMQLKIRMLFSETAVWLKATKVVSVDDIVLAYDGIKGSVYTMLINAFATAMARQRDVADFLIDRASEITAIDAVVNAVFQQWYFDYQAIGADVKIEEKPEQ